MLRSMYSGISGIRNFQTKLDVIGNNIANVNTFGYKKGRVTFKDTISQTLAGASTAQGNRGGVNPMQVGLGAAIATIDNIHTAGSLQTTGRSLDLAINGDGYFVFRQGNQLFYSRAGNLYLDNQGTLVNGDGLKVQAFNQYGELSDVVVNVNAVLPFVETTEITIPGNLSSDSGIDFVYSQQFEVVDENGEPQRVNIYFKKVASGPEQWEVYFKEPQAGDTPTMRLNFDNQGKVASIIDSLGNTVTGSQIQETITIGGKNYSYDFIFDNLTALPGSNDAIILANGNTEGQLESFNIGPLGEINAVYTNGLVTTLGILALAKFSNPSGLMKAGGNLFQESVNSGTANIDVPGTGRGTIASSALEMSNVDLSEEFTEMIVAQRGFQANTRIITTSDEILQELVNLKR